MAITAEVLDQLLSGLSDEARDIVTSDARRLLVIAGAGAGKTEAMARRIAWWHGRDGIPKEQIVAFTFTEQAAEEMKFRIRKYIQVVEEPGVDPSLGGMYVGTIHGFCLNTLRKTWPDEYHNDDVIDDVARYSLVQEGYNFLLGLKALENALKETSGRSYQSRGQTINHFLNAYDLLNEYDQLDVELSDEPRPQIGAEQEWCRQARLRTHVGDGPVAQAFATAAARYYAYLRCRHFLDFSTAQSELTRRLRSDESARSRLRSSITHLVVDEVQDINPVQDEIRRMLVDETDGWLTAVGDHRQAIYGWRGGRIDIMAGLSAELRRAEDGDVLELTANYRSTPRIIDVSNRWNTTINVPGEMPSPDMTHGRAQRIDADPCHVGILDFGGEERADEALWIAETVKGLVPNGESGAAHDTPDGERGITYADIAVLVRTTTDARTYMQALRNAGVPAVVKAGPDLFAQAEVLLFAAALSLSGGRDTFYGADWNPRSLPNRLDTVLGITDAGVQGTAQRAVRAAFAALSSEGLRVEPGAADRVIAAAEAMNARLNGNAVDPSVVRTVRTSELRRWLSGRDEVRRVFPQTMLQWLMAEGGVSAWDSPDNRAVTAMYHLGQLSSLITGIETPGWTRAKSYTHQITSLLLWATESARPQEAPLLATPDAVTVTTIHSVKGLQYAAVFVADVCSYRFPSSNAKKKPSLPFEGELAEVIAAENLADNANNDDERRLMYVALTRAERFLFVSASKPSKFFKELTSIIAGAGGTVQSSDESTALPGLRLLPSERSREDRLITSFSDLRYYLECPHDFYLRKVLGFTPTVDQAFGYGRGIHNLMRAVHSNPAFWAGLATDPPALKQAVQALIDRGLFYLRHTTGEPAANMHRRGVEIVTDYVRTYAKELETLSFEPEREFEVLVPGENVLIAGAIDVVRLDSPPRVTIIDFKSGERETDKHDALDEDEMRLQVSLYAVAARQELEYEPERGLVRYLGERDRSRKELAVPLDEETISDSIAAVSSLAGGIQRRQFRIGPRKPDKNGDHRCTTCDWSRICGLKNSTPLGE
ncbi:ATP-dependent helicase [Actinomadura craniellae]|uniref:DNA 3'-5' helicase n=1 Tax=Actinomadura craniellae TaxID=2231787 RepID=A0A365GVC0_9ACTN|nr:ATP-dependent DNA helicase [Actinomadura craniellae]RAY10744.1 ATP-dependent helicase [Actinomadura craniellae]